MIPETPHIDVVIFGYGAVGRATADLLIKSGRRIRIVQRTQPADLPQGVAFVAADILDGDAVRAATRGAAQIVVALGFAYEAKVWRRSWPRAMANILAAAEATAARVVFFDNLYMYGPQDVPLREDMPLTSFGDKPAVRAEITRMWMAASSAGRVRFAALRAPDFYGPGVGKLSHFGDLSFGALAAGKPALLIIPPDMPHDFAYVPDLGRAVVTLIDAPDDAYGQAWHAPSAPTRAPREIIGLAAASLGVKPRITAVPMWSLPALGLIMPLLKGLIEMRFQWDRPYQVDHTKWAKRFWNDTTPFEVGVRETALRYRTSATRAA
jgi:nucleoside-diphosphate-sugar epimerase